MKKYDKNSKFDDLDFEKLKDLRHNKINAWASERFKLRYPQFYSKELKDILNRHFQAIMEYLQGNSLKETAIKYKLTKTILTRITRDILNRSSMEDLLRSIIGNQGELGLELAVADLKIFYFENNTLPKTKQEGMITIRNAIHSNNYWKKFGIKSWDDLLVHAFGEEKIKELRDLEEKNLFNKAISELKSSYNKKSRLPKFEDKETYWIGGAVTRGIWKKFGISTWNDLLKQVFGEVNIEHNLYEGIEGLNNAQEELRKFYEKYKKLPITKDFEQINGVIHRKVWQEFGISKWNDLLKKVFGKVNLNLQYDYTDEDSFSRVQKRLRKFNIKNGRLPKSTDEKMSSISNAISRGMFKEQGVLTWNDLLKNTFNEVNREFNIYEGRQGFEEAVQELKNFKEKYGKDPAVGDKDVIYRTVKRGEWTEFGISSWDELLNYTFGEFNLKKNKYKGRQGLERAINELKEFKKEYGNKPTSRSNGMTSIYNTIEQGEWKKFGIKSWNDLLNLVFGEIYYEKNKYKGRQGLDRAIQVLKNYKNENGRKPSRKNKGMGGISTAIRRGEWKDFNINSWNDLLILVFGEINYEPNKYLGRKGLNRAIQELREFKTKFGKKPTSTSKGISGIYTAIKRGEWKEYGINNWNDLLMDTFGEVYFEIDKYIGKQGLEKAIQELKVLKKMIGKKPTANSRGTSSIYKIIQKGEWKEFGIETWNDLLNATFGEIYVEKNKYIGKEGFERAKQVLMDFKQMNKKLPIVNSKGMGGVVKAILRGEWKEFGINSWNDLLYATFGVINKERIKYLGKEGLDRAIQVLKEFKRINRVKPKSNSSGIYGIYNNARNGIWKEFGINSWNDLLRLVFGEIHTEKGKYVGKKGLDRAIREMIEYKKNNGKNPTSKTDGFKGIYDNAARRGQWKQFGITSWNDLIKYAFREKIT